MLQQKMKTFSPGDAIGVLRQRFLLWISFRECDMMNLHNQRNSDTFFGADPEAVGTKEDSP